MRRYDVRDAKKCQVRGCENKPSKDPRRFIFVPHGSGERRLQVCDGCNQRWRVRGTLKRVHPDRSKVAPKIVALRKKGLSAAEINRYYPDVPRRTIFHIFNAHGLRGSPPAKRQAAG